MSKTKQPSGTKWCVINQNFPLTESENQTINRHDSLWREHCEGGKPVDALAVELEFKGFVNDAEAGDEQALEMLNRFGTLEAFMRFRRAEQTGRRARFDRDHSALFSEVHPIAKRLRDVFEKLLKQYRNGGEDERKLLGLPPVINDDATSLMERTIAGLFAVESHIPSTFEVMANHVQLLEIEEVDA